MTQALVLYQPPPTRELQARLVVLSKLQAQVQELEADYDRTNNRIRDFEKRYKPAVGDRYQELEDLRAKISHAWFELNKARRGRYEKRHKEKKNKDLEQEAFKPEVELKNLFRELARRIHPDRAEDVEDGHRRHEFMSEATGAYRNKDLQRLQWLMEHWEAAPRLPRGFDPEARIARTNQRIAWLRYRVRELNISITALNTSSVARIMDEAEHARGQGRNLVAELRSRVMADLEETRADLAKVEEAMSDLDAPTVRLIRKNAGLD